MSPWGPAGLFLAENLIENPGACDVQTLALVRRFWNKWLEKRASASILAAALTGQCHVPAHSTNF
jgi:hypothetical protein